MGTINGSTSGGMARGAGIYLLHDDGQLVQLAERAYDSEAILQELIASYPSILAGDQMGRQTPRRWLLICREMAVPSEENGADRWAVDHLFLDQDAVPTLVEVKRSNDTRIRREVVGQMLDYAANAIVYWPVERLRATFETTCRQQGREPEEVLGEALGAVDPEQFWLRVRTNLQAGRVRLIFVADAIPQELQRVIEFLNVQMDPAQVLGVEIRQFVGSGLKTLVPRLIGMTAEAEQRKGLRSWDETSFLDALESRCGADSARVAREILEWLPSESLSLRLSWGAGKQDGSFSAVVEQSGRHTLFTVYTSGKLYIALDALRSRTPFNDERASRELVRRLNEFAGGSIREDAKYPPIPLSALGSKATLQQFLGTLDWIVRQIRGT